MKLILKKDVQSLGESGEVVEVKDGFARNYLLPQGFAEVATAGSLKNREKNLERIKQQTEKLYQEALQKAEVIKKLEKLEISVKAGENGKLFGAVTTKKLADLVQEKAGVEIDKRSITLNNPINMLGEYKMLIKITSKVSVNLPVIAVASEIIKEARAIEEEVVETYQGE
ncbi:MAG TPA: 50S ribosomal protein L9 [Candidatus Gastranaerophilales bacterium]|nr:50S ribosomal protein L9 [Candidatus Gastranaerophilales bacterium]